MAYRLTALLAVMALAATPVSAIAVAVNTPSTAAAAPWVAPSGTTGQSSVSTSQAHVDKSARKAIKVAGKQARKCAKLSRKAASARSDRKRAKYHARYIASCGTAAMAPTITSPSTSTGSTVIDELSGSEAITSVTAPSGAPGLPDMAAGFPPELALSQVPEPGTLALLGLGLAGLGLGVGRRKKI